jgi:hypothetical protein
MQKLMCELCNSNNFTKDDDGYFVCDYCRTKYTPVQAQSMMVEGTVRVDRTGDISGLISIASTSLASNNIHEAYEYANRVLEIDPQNSIAWQVKGTSVGRMSTLEQLRFTEMQNAFDLAIQNAADVELGAIKQKCAQEIRYQAVNFFNLSSEHAIKTKNLNGTWEAHVARSEAVLDALSISYRWDPIKTTLTNYIDVVSTLIIGIPYFEYNKSGSVYHSVRQLTAAHKLHAHSQIAWAGAEIKKIDPTYVTPIPQTQAKESKCFVVTATMGNENAFPVVTLREFRDTVLIDYKIGRRFVVWYNENGPRIARSVETSRILRLVALVVLVAPFTLCAWVVIRVRDVKL